MHPNFKTYSKPVRKRKKRGVANPVAGTNQTGGVSKILPCFLDALGSCLLPPEVSPRSEPPAFRFFPKTAFDLVYPFFAHFGEK